MTRTTRRTLPAFALLFALALGCGEEAPPAAATEPAAQAAAVQIPELDVAQVASLLEGGGCTVVDANSAETRERRGVVPGAVLLTSSSRYELSELPEDRAKKLVFYCGGTQCTASDRAAERAAQAGYQDVAVMRPGIAGWVEAGRPTQPAS